MQSSTGSFHEDWKEHKTHTWALLIPYFVLLTARLYASATTKQTLYIVQWGVDLFQYPAMFLLWLSVKWEKEKQKDKLVVAALVLHVMFLISCVTYNFLVEGMEDFESESDVNKVWPPEFYVGP